MKDDCALPSELTIYTVSELYPTCLAWLETDLDDATECDKLRVGAQAVTDVDAAGVQLLLSLSNSLRARQRDLFLENPSEPLQAACLALGAASLVRHGMQKGPTP